MDIEKLDRYMARTKIDCSDIKFYDPRKGGFSVEGLYWFDSEKCYRRFPAAAEGKVTPSVWTLSCCPTGGQIRFATDSRRIVISVKNTDAKVNVTMAEIARSGCDLYCGTPGVDEEFWNTAWPVPGELVYTYEIFNVPEKQVRNFRINLPLYNGVDEVFIGLEKDSKILPPVPLKSHQPIVVYGTSIT